MHSLRTGNSLEQKTVKATLEMEMVKKRFLGGVEAIFQNGFHLDITPLRPTLFMHTCLLATELPQTRVLSR